ncbi:hypothetical protein [Streptomyces sp. XH2]|uniref:hypothetical protein n=1 Tax=Streptomyces sp. XH2 TaxID=3412483 RepID=UPI003C7CB8CD
MSTIIQGNQVRSILFGVRVSKSYAAFAAETATLFTVTGGKVLVTSLVGEVTTAITVANTVKLQANPTTGTTKDLCAATDIGTTDTPVGDLLSFQGLTGDSILHGPGAVPTLKQPLVINTGTIEQVTTGTGPDGAVTWVLTYVPLDDGAAVVAA